VSYTYLLEQGEESSAECFSDIPASVLSRLNLTAERSSCGGNEMESFPSSQSGMMCEPLTGNHGEGKLISYAEDSPGSDQYKSDFREFLRDGTEDGQYPSPSVSEWVMGWPIGYTELEPLGMDRFQEWFALHGKR